MGRLSEKIQIEDKRVKCFIATITQMIFLKFYSCIHGKILINKNLLNQHNLQK